MPDGTATSDGERDPGEDERVEETEGELEPESGRAEGEDFARAGEDCCVSVTSGKTLETAVVSASPYANI
jgi:hypothetical protein